MKKHRKDHKNKSAFRGKHDSKAYTGIITIVSKGVGYVPIPNFDEDIEIGPEWLNTAFHGDRVEIRLRGKERGRQQGAVHRVLERSRNTFVGTLHREGDGWQLKPDARRVYTELRVLSDGKYSSQQEWEDQKALVRLREWNDPRVLPKAELVELLGPAGSHETEMRAIVAERGFDTGFPTDVEMAAQKLRANKKTIFAEEEKVRRDFRDRNTFTIDPDDAKDFDDAISVQELQSGDVELGVHIADVSAFVKKGDIVDQEALQRGTSIYLVDRTIPMLPEALSNDLCSLTPGEDKLAFSAVFIFDKSMTMKEQWFGRTIIKSDKRFTYDEAQNVLDTGKGTLKKELFHANAISTALRKERFKKGGIVFETDEVKFRLDKDGKPLSVYVKERRETSLLIEDLMLFANRKVAEFVTKNCNEISKGKCTFVYRVHDVPKPEKIAELGIFLKAIGHELKGAENGRVETRDINALFKKIQGTPEQNLIETATIRSMAKAVYSVKNIGHFGLSFEYYTHFTSPIRRYPDLMVHRILASHLDGSPISSREFNEYERLSIQCSEREIAAVEAERDSIKYKQVEFLKDRVGEEFDATVSGVTEWGMYVEEKNTKAEGLVSMRSLKSDWFSLDKKHYRLVGEKTKQKFSLGDSVRVRLTGADMERKMLDFTLA